MSDERSAADDLAEGWAERELERVGEHLPAVVDAELAPASLFPRNPMHAMREMSALVTMMHQVVQSGDTRKYIATIQGRPYPCVTWWTTIALPLQLVPQIAWSKRIDTLPDSGFAVETWQARCEVMHTPTGRVIASGEGLCSMSETARGKPRWEDSHAVMAMAQTRAIGRAFRQCLAGLAVMAGLEATPAEEMPASKQAPTGDVLPDITTLVPGDAPQPLGTITAIQPRPWKAKREGDKPSGWVEVADYAGRLYTPSDPEEHGWGVGDRIVGVVSQVRTSKGGRGYAQVYSVRKADGGTDAAGGSAGAAATAPASRVHKPTTGTADDPDDALLVAAVRLSRDIITGYGAEVEEQIRLDAGYGTTAAGRARTHYTAIKDAQPAVAEFVRMAKKQMPPQDEGDGEEEDDDE